MRVQFSTFFRARFSAGGTGRKVTMFECVLEGRGLQ